MPPFLTDTTVITVLITSSTGVLIAVVNGVFSRKEAKTSRQFEHIIDNLDNLKDKVKTIDETTISINQQNDAIQDGTKKIQRYRLFHDLSKEISQGYTTLEHYRELSILFESYKNLGGNGEIEALYENFKELPIKEQK